MSCHAMPRELCCTVFCLSLVVASFPPSPDEPAPAKVLALSFFALRFAIFDPAHAVGDPQVSRRLPALRVSPKTTDHSTTDHSTDQRVHDPAQQTIRSPLLACCGCCWCRLEGGKGLGKARHQGDQPTLKSLFSLVTYN